MILRAHSLDSFLLYGVNSGNWFLQSETIALCVSTTIYKIKVRSSKDCIFFELSMPISHSFDVIKLSLDFPFFFSRFHSKLLSVRDSTFTSLSSYTLKFEFGKNLVMVKSEHHIETYFIKNFKKFYNHPCVFQIQIVHNFHLKYFHPGVAFQY